MLKNFRLSFALATLTLVSSLGVASKASADTATVTISEAVPATCLFDDVSNYSGTLGYDIANKTLSTTSGAYSVGGSISVVCNTSGTILISTVTPTIPDGMTQPSLTASILNTSNAATATHNGTASNGSIALASGTNQFIVNLNVQYAEVLAPGNYSYAILLTATP
jgi:hypothetical protein